MRVRNANINGLFDWFDTIHRPSSKFPSTYSDLPEDQDDWDCNHWYVYYNRNKSAGGKTYAMEVFEIDAGNVNSFADLGWCKYDCEFINYFRTEGFAIDNFFGDVFCNVTGTVENVTKTGYQLTKWIIPLGLIGLGVAGYVYYDQNHK